MVQNVVLPNTWNACLGMFQIVIYCITFLAKLTLSVTQKQHSLPTRCRSRSLWCRNQVVRKGTNLNYHVTVSLNITGFFVCLLACLSVSIFFLRVPDVISFKLYAGKVPVPFRDFQSSVNPRPVSQCQLAAKWTRVCDMHSGEK